MFGNQHKFQLLISRLESLQIILNMLCLWHSWCMYLMVMRAHAGLIRHYPLGSGHAISHLGHPIWGHSTLIVDFHGGVDIDMVQPL